MVTSRYGFKGKQKNLKKSRKEAFLEKETPLKTWHIMYLSLSHIVFFYSCFRHFFQKILNHVHLNVKPFDFEYPMNLHLRQIQLSILLIDNHLSKSIKLFFLQHSRIIHFNVKVYLTACWYDDYLSLFSFQLLPSD